VQAVLSREETNTHSFIEVPGQHKTSAKYERPMVCFHEGIMKKIVEFAERVHRKQFSLKPQDEWANIPLLCNADGGFFSSLPAEITKLCCKILKRPMSATGFRRFIATYCHKFRAEEYSSAMLHDPATAKRHYSEGCKSTVFRGTYL
jgi:hypothetical protein